MKRWATAWVIVVFFGVAGCGEADATKEELRAIAKEAIDAHRSKIEERLVLYQEIGRLAEAVPRENLPAFDIGDRPKLVPNYRDSQYTDGLQEGNPHYAEIPARTLHDPRVARETSRQWFTRSLSGWFQFPFEIMDGEWEDNFRQGSKELAESYFAGHLGEFLKPRYLLIVRTHEMHDGVRLADDEDPEDYFGRKIIGNYIGGRFVGDFVLFDTQDKAFLGGVAMTVDSSSQISMEKIERDPDFIRSDLRNSMGYKLEQAMKPISAR